MILFKVNGMSENNPELAQLESRQISPTIAVTANWQKVAYRSLLKPTEVVLLQLSELKPITTVNLDPQLSCHQLKIKYTPDLFAYDDSKTLETYGLTMTSSGDDVTRGGAKVPLNLTLSKINQSQNITYMSPASCGIQIGAKLKAQNV